MDDGVLAVGRGPRGGLRTGGVGIPQRRLWNPPPFPLAYHTPRIAGVPAYRHTYHTIYYRTFSEHCS